LDNHQEWHVVPSGGAKARTSSSVFHPYPCRYDEYDIYLSAHKTKDADYGPQPRVDSISTSKENKENNNREANNKHKRSIIGETTTSERSNECIPKHTDPVDMAGSKIVVENLYHGKQQ
jgi:hypothetical protein